MLRRSMSIRNNSIAAPKNYSPQSVPKTAHRRARRERREKAEKITCGKGVYAAPEYVDPKQFHCRPQKPFTALQKPIFIYLPAKKGAWFDVKKGGSFVRIRAIAGCLLNSLSRNRLTFALSQPFG